MYRLKRLEFWLGVIISVLFIASVSDASVKTENYKMIENSLQTQMQKDMSDKTLKVQITRASDMRLSENRQTIFGDAYLVSKSKTEQTPIYFEAIFDAKTKKIAIVDYTFLDSEAEINNNFLQKLVIKKIGNDFKTNEVAVAMDQVELIEEVGNREKYRGYGEVRIGSLVWKKIRFEINLTADSEQILYKLDEM